MPWVPDRELEFGSVGFGGDGKNEVPGEVPLGARERTNNKLNSTDAGVLTRVTVIGEFRVLSPRRHLCFYSVSKNTVADPGEGLPSFPPPPAPNF